ESGIVGISYFQLDGTVVDANDRYLAMLGATRETLRDGRVRWDRLTPAEWMPRTLEAVAELKEKGRCEPFEKEVLRLDGTRFWAYFGGALLDEDQAVAFVLDIDAFRKAQDALEQQAVELARSNEELQSFAYAASHDLREPLRMINIYSQLLRRMYDEAL